MSNAELLADLRSRINPKHATQPGTESNERRLCAEAIEALQAQRDALAVNLFKSQEHANQEYLLRKSLQAEVARLTQRTEKLEGENYEMACPEIYAQDCPDIYAQQPAQQEPVAAQMRVAIASDSGWSEWREIDIKDADREYRAGVETRKLYTAPPARQPIEPTGLPFVRWSKEAEMRESWSPQPAAQETSMLTHDDGFIAGEMRAKENFNRAKQEIPVSQPVNPSVESCNVQALYTPRNRS